ncbi:MAG: hypothetical protein QOJ07_2487 [Thermoleophilaceae bacterium]|nr:hypothetical protein [Thermoleophilaceae bacterium]
MDSHPQQPVRLHVSPLAYLAVIGLTALLLAIAIVLVMTLTVLRESRERIKQQDAKIGLLLKGTQPALGEVKPALRQATPLLRDARGLVAPLRRSALSVTSAADSLPVLLSGASVLIEDSLPLVHEALPLVRSLDSFLATVQDRQVVLKLSAGLDRVPTFERLLTDVVDVQHRTLAVQRRTLHVQLRTFRNQQRTLRLFFRSVAIQRETLDHTRSIDAKTGGPAPVPVP